MSTIALVALRCAQIELALIKGSSGSRLFTELFNQVCIEPEKYRQLLLGLSPEAKIHFRGYCLIQKLYYLKELHNAQNSAVWLKESAVKLVEIEELLDLLT
jgi:hypothetical protein